VLAISALDGSQQPAPVGPVGAARTQSSSSPS